jgi:hypothetical protein
MEMKSFKEFALFKMKGPRYSVPIIQASKYFGIMLIEHQDHENVDWKKIFFPCKKWKSNQKLCTHICQNSGV